MRRLLLVSLAAAATLLGCDARAGDVAVETREEPAMIPAAPPSPPPAPATSPADDGRIDRFVVRVVAEYPHDPTAFTQGLVWDGGALYESTGLYGASSLRRVDPATGKVLARELLAPDLFGEGLARIGDRLILLTWKSGIAQVRDLATLALREQIDYEGDGWGLGWDGTSLLMTDGTARLAIRDPDTFRLLRSVEITEEGRPLAGVNELEMVGEHLWGNVWGQERIVRIDPATGRVTGSVDASGLLSDADRRRVDVMNGIAWDPVSETFWITGKYWPAIFQVVFEPVL